MTNVMTPLTTAQISTTFKTDYCGNVVYENGAVSKILTEEGYITLAGTTPTYHYYLKDHQGNNRVVINQAGTVEQVNHYYPFGGLMGESTAGGVQPYKYNGKELDRMHGLDLFDYGARHYDAIIGRWWTVDPLAEKYYGMSPYVYVANNPVRFIDPNGMDIWQLDKMGNVINTVTHDIDGNKLTYDRIEVHNEKGVVLGQTSDFELGAIQYSKVTVGTGDKAWSYDQFTVNGIDNATSVFQTVADNTKVEWSYGVFGEGTERLSFLTTTHNEWNEGGMRDVWLKQYMKEVPMVSHTHNHPTHNVYAPYPSGLPGTDDFGSGDISFSTTITNNQGNISKITPTFQIYDPRTKTFIPYGPNSVKSNFKYFNK